MTFVIIHRFCKRGNCVRIECGDEELRKELGALEKPQVTNSFYETRTLAGWLINEPIYDVLDKLYVKGFTIQCDGCSGLVLYKPDK